MYTVWLQTCALCCVCAAVCDMRPVYSSESCVWAVSIEAQLFYVPCLILMLSLPILKDAVVMWDCASG